MDINRKYEHRDYGHIGTVRLTVPDEGWTLAGEPLPREAVEHLATFALQTLQDAYAGAGNSSEAKAAWTKKLERIIEGKIGVREGGPRNPVQKRAIEIALGHVKTTKSGDVYTATLGRFTSEGEDREKVRRAVASRAVENNPAYMHLAEKQVEEQRAMGIPDDDSDDVEDESDDEEE